MCRQEPLLYCPECATDGLALALNKDLFPHLLQSNKNDN